MARCACGSATCACIIQAAPNGGIVVVGNGSATRPYQIAQAGGGNPLMNLDVLDDPSLDLTITGTGTATDKRLITGKAKPSMRELRDVDATDVPANGDVVTWSSALSKWVFSPPAAASLPAGGSIGDVLTKLSGAAGDAAWRPNPFVQELGPGVDLNTLQTTGTYIQSQNAETSLPLNYPIAQAGLLEVVYNGGGSGGMVWQRYTVYASGSIASGAVFERGLYTSTWQPWKQVAGLYNDDAICTAAVVLSTTANTDITGMTLTVPVPGPNSVFQVNTVFDVNTQAATANTFVGQVSVAGSALTGQAIWVPTTGVLSGGRQMITQNHRVTGLANGSHIFKAFASCSVANQFRINASHSTFAVTQIA